MTSSQLVSVCTQYVSFVVSHSLHYFASKRSSLPSTPENILGKIFSTIFNIYKYFFTFKKREDIDKEIKRKKIHKCIFKQRYKKELIKGGC